MLRGLWSAAHAGPWRAFGLILAAGLIATAVLTRIAAEVYDEVTDADGVAGLDRTVLGWMVDHRTPGLNTWITRFTDLGGTTWLPVLGTIAAVAIALWWRSLTPMIMLLVSGLGGVLLVRVGKAAVGRTRPPLADAVPPFESSFAFPSGHSLNTMVIAMVVAYLLVLKQRRLPVRVLTVAGAAVFAVAMGASRVYLGHHWLTDVLCGQVLGLAWVVMVITGHRLLVNVRTRSGPSPTPAADPSPSSARTSGSP
jgi:membrane-associated phospholipid phosphatase